MQLTPPKQIVFWISLILFVVGIIGFFVGYASYAFWAVVVGYVVLALGNATKGL